MLIPFEEMPDHARLWIYQAERSLSDQEVEFVAKNTTHFLNQWQAHGQDLKASFDVRFNQFLIITVDEAFSQASGCSIDASVHLIKALENELQLSFITSGKVAFLHDEVVELYPFNELKSQVQQKTIQPETTVFDNTVQNMGDFKQKWMAESKNTWVGRYFR